MLELRELLDSFNEVMQALNILVKVSFESFDELPYILFHVFIKILLVEFESNLECSKQMSECGHEGMLLLHQCYCQLQAYRPQV